MVGAGYLSEGIQRLLFAKELGSGRIAKIGLPNPDFFSSFVGTFEIFFLGVGTARPAYPISERPPHYHHVFRHRYHQGRCAGRKGPLGDDARQPYVLVVYAAGK